MDERAESRLNAIAGELEASRGIELAVVVVDDVPGTPKAFATELFNHWGIGKAATNNGVLVLLVMGKRRLEIETGTGMEAALTAAWLADMQAREMVPRFKQRDFAGGLVAGVEAIAAHLKAAPGESTSTAPPGEYRSDGAPGSAAPLQAVDGAASSPAPPALADEEEGEGGLVAPLATVGGIGAAGVGGGVLFARIRRRRRRCEKCRQQMLRLDELADDEHLDPGQRTEERIGSMDYEVRICPGCQASRTFTHSRWFSGYSRCAGCSYKAGHSNSTTIVEATYDHGGEIQIDEGCAHCPRTATYTRSTPARTRPSTSSSSSSGSSWSSSGGSSGFGGGSSSGGGAGSSW